MKKGASFTDLRPLTKNFFDVIKDARKTIISLYGDAGSLRYFAEDKWLHNIRMIPLYLTTEEMIEHVGQQRGETIIIDSKEKSKIRELPNGIIKIRLSPYEDESRDEKEMNFVVSNTKFLLEELGRMEKLKEEEKKNQMIDRVQQKNREKGTKDEDNNLFTIY